MYLRTPFEIEMRINPVATIAENIKILEDAAIAQVTPYDATLVPAVNAIFNLLGGFLTNIETMAANSDKASVVNVTQHNP